MTAPGADGEPVVWGLVGTRGYAARACLPAFAAAHGATLGGIASSDAARAEEAARVHAVPAAHGDLDGLLAQPGIEAVWIASPSYLHFEQARATLLAGKHVLLEKPLALTAEEAWKLVRLAEEADLVLATGYQARYVPAHLRMRSLIAEGAIGRVVTARTLYGMRRTGAPSGWRGDREKARWGVLADIGTHHIDLLRMLAGEIADVSGFTAHQRGFGTEDLATASFRFASGAVGSLTATSSHYKPTTVVEVYGTEGALVATDTSPDGQGGAVLLRADAEPEDVTGERPSSWLAQLETVSRAVAGDEIAYATGEDGARNLEVLERILP
jgi:1,5-anhydro-D-fructose reductase (1,5-anhydro-D-mannitol-forming)